MGHKQIYRIQKNKYKLHQNNDPTATEPNPSISLSMSSSDHLESSDTTSTAIVVLPANLIGDRNRQHNITAVCITTIYDINQSIGLLLLSSSFFITFDASNY